MPSSSVSDGVQSLITEKYPQGIYCAVETSGDGAVNFQSRVQMYLFKARKVAEKELQDTLDAHGLTMAQVHSFLDKNPRFKGALHRSPFSAGSTPADLINEVADHIQFSTAQRFVRDSKASLLDALDWTRGAVLGAPTSAQKTLELGKELAAELKDITRDHGPTLVKKGVEQAKAKVATIPFASQVTSLFERAS